MRKIIILAVLSGACFIAAPAQAHHTTTWNQDKIRLESYVDSVWCGGGWYTCYKSPLVHDGYINMWNCTTHSRCAPYQDQHQYIEQNLGTGYFHACHVGRNTKIYHGTLYRDGGDYCGPMSSTPPYIP